VSAVLIADDKASSRELLRVILEHMGHSVLEAEDGHTVVQIAKRTVPDLILLDLRMPLVDGFGAFRILRLDPQLSQIPVVVLTASATMGEEEAIRAAGFDEYLTKPISVAGLREVVMRFVGASATTGAEISREVHSEA
jgi:CheY-like chemotaxis protein